MFSAAMRALGFRSAAGPKESERREPSAAPRNAPDGDKVTDAWIEDLRRQVGRLEGQVDDLQHEIHDQRETHAEEMRRKDILVQGAMQQIAHLTEIAGLPPPSPELMKLEVATSTSGADGERPADASRTGTLEPEVEPPAQRSVAAPRQQSATGANRPSGSDRRKSSESLSVPGWATIEVFEAARLPG